MKRDTRLGSRIAEVHNGSSLFTGSAGQGESNIRRWIIENDWLEAIVALPLNMFYNTGIATYVWVLTNRKPEHRRGKVQLIDATKWFRPLRKNLGKKNCELGPEAIERICRTFLEFEETEESRVFDNEAFGYWKVTVERPLRLRVDLSPERCAGFSEACRVAGEEPLANAVARAAKTLGSGPHLDFNVFLDVLKADMSGRRAKLTAKRKKLLRTALAERDEKAERVVKRVHRRGTAPDPIRGLYESRDDSKARVVEYEPDTALRDTEQIPLQEEGRIEGFLRREVLPYTADAWYVAKSVKIGYEISFNRYFHKPAPMRTLDEIRAEIATVEREAAGLLGGLPGRAPVPAYPKMRVYADTSVIGGCEDDEFREPSRRLIERCARGEVTLVVSAVTAGELRRAPPPVRRVLPSIGPEHLERVEVTREVEILANGYIESGALGEGMRADALHIAAATVADVDVLASWNFRHMVNLRRIRQYNDVNRLLGYPPVDIRTPKELEDEE